MKTTLTIFALLTFASCSLWDDPNDGEAKKPKYGIVNNNMSTVYCDSFQMESTTSVIAWDNGTKLVIKSNTPIRIYSKY